MGIFSLMEENFVLLLLLLSPAASDPDVVQVNPGDDATLPCQVHRAPIRAVEWTRTDPESPVLFFRDGHTDTPFKGRVQLLDRDLKDGDVSLILKNVSSSDAGTYECRVAAGRSRSKRALIEEPPIRRIRLEVPDPGPRSGDTEDADYRLYAGLAAAAAAAAAAVCLAAVAVGVRRTC
ncbi:butyrophilin-like protein 1 isoform X1 [Micropterus dolomieu]|uniref:butyrophilin-like protein 1 isoform X1 n=2 Tax=Micropterus dolomieu TaxID=147949 RepID=UPI001E8CCBC7|nr:butyrophilin-like protein 1 isoform X1 [Micropterus dolomieu]